MATPTTKQEMKDAYKKARDDIHQAYNTENYEDMDTSNIADIMNMKQADIEALGFSVEVANAMAKWCAAFKALAPEYQAYKTARLAFKSEMETIKDILV